MIYFVITVISLVFPVDALSHVGQLAIFAIRQRPLCFQDKFMRSDQKQRKI